MTYLVTCSCGRTQEVQAAQAGTSIHCVCGGSIDVPTLSRLRVSAGQEAVPRSTIERIRDMIRSGTLPDGDVCPYSGHPANDVRFVRVQCERSWATGGPITFTEKVLAYTVLGLGGLLMALRITRPRQEFGRETSVDVPLRIAADCRSKLLRLKSQKRWKRLLQRTAIYDELLKEFPGATVAPCTKAPTSGRDLSKCQTPN